MGDKERHDTVPDLNRLAAQIAEQADATVPEPAEPAAGAAPSLGPEYIGTTPIPGSRPWHERAPDWVAGGLAGLGVGILVTFVIVSPGGGPTAADATEAAAAEAAAAEAAAAEAAAAEAAAAEAAEAAAAEAAAAAAALRPVRAKPKSRPKPVVEKAVPAPTLPAKPDPRKSSTLMLTAKGKSSAGPQIAAKVYVDDKYVGMAPISSYAVLPGTRRIRFDCIFEGKTHRGKDKVIEIPSDTDAAIEHTCDVWVTLGR